MDIHPGSSNRGGDQIDDVNELLEMIEQVGSYTEYRKTQRKECLNLVRRLKLLVPLFEELKELEKSVSGFALNSLLDLRKSMLLAKKLLKNCNNGSKIYLAMEGEAVMAQFHGVYDKLNQALDDFPFDQLGISVEVKEQVELMKMQLKRAKKRADTQDMELAMDMMVVFSKKEDRNADTAILERLAKKLELHTIPDLKEETVAIKKLVKKRGGKNEATQQIIDLLGKFKEVVGLDASTALDGPMSSRSLQRCQSSLVPNEYLCPITLEIMTDPVIVATGQTYERESIERWLNSKHRTCPKTGQTLQHLSLAPNFALRNLILQWCEKNNVELPKKDNPARQSEKSSSELMDEISSLVQALSLTQLDEQRDATMRLRMLSKESPENRILIANNGGIPILIQQLCHPDLKIQEHTVTALLNLSIDETNKRLIAREGAIPAMIDILQTGTDEAKENSAAALFSLSMLDENKVLVGAMNGIPSLVYLLQNGTTRGKKDAATALFNLCLNKTNKSRAIEAGIFPPLLHLLEEKSLGMVDEALSILLLLASHPEGQIELGKRVFVEKLVEIMRDGTAKNKECATSVLLELGLKNSSLILAALQVGVYEHLREIVRCGTNRAQRKANSLLQHMSKCEHIP